MNDQFPTRISVHAQSLIDHVLTNYKSKPMVVNTVEWDVSDHYLLVCDAFLPKSNVSISSISETFTTVRK